MCTQEPSPRLNATYRSRGRSRCGVSRNFAAGASGERLQKLHRKLVLDDRASETARARARAPFEAAGLLEAVLSSADRRLTLRAATPRIYSISSSSTLFHRLSALSPSLLPLPSPFARAPSRPPRHSRCPLTFSRSRARLSSRRRHANSRDARNIKS